ncbi:MAG: restriction endonuclease subunit S [Chloroflexota bacterium]
MIKWQIPNNWEWKELSEVSRINPRRPKIQRDDSQQTSFVPMEDVDEIEGKFKQIRVRPFREVKTGYTYFEENDVLYAKITPSMENGKTAIASGLIDNFGFGTTEFHVLRPNRGILPEYLHYYIRRMPFRQEAKQHFRGAVGQQRVPKDFLVTYPIPVPCPDEPKRSLLEQRRIVARIVALLAEVREMRKLHGEITADLNQLDNAVLMETLQELRSKSKSKTISELLADKSLQIRGGGTPRRSKKSFWSGDIPWVSPKDMKTWLIDDSTEHINDEAIDNSSARRIPAGAVLVVVRGMILAHTWPVAVTMREVTINQDMKALIPDAKINSKYLGYILRASASEVLHKVETAAHGTKRLKTSTLEQIPIPIVDIHTQERLVAWFDNLFSEHQQIQEVHNEKAVSIGQLEQAILSQAFRGEL